MPMQTKIGKTTLRLVTGDIADQDTDAVVTAAHWRLNKGTGTDGTIHTRGGPRIYEECRRIGGCPIGDAVITTGGDLRLGFYSSSGLICRLLTAVGVCCCRRRWLLFPGFFCCGPVRLAAGRHILQQPRQLFLSICCRTTPLLKPFLP